MKLNASQKAAAEHLSGPMLVLAGPGSGKTSVIARRCAFLIEEAEVAPERILVVSFSRSAAEEMKERYLSLTGRSHTRVNFGTFHGIFYGILKRAYGYSAENILSPREREEILQSVAARCVPAFAEERSLIEEIRGEISQVKRERIPVDYFHSSHCSDEIFKKVYEGYSRALRDKRKLDFDDMILGCYELLKRRPDILEGWQRQFSQIMVDEFQDINRLQYEVIRMLAAPDDNLFVVGDDDQSIYHFRGASPRFMLDFQKTYPNAQTVCLDTCYRCPANILETAQRLVSCNEERFEKKLISSQGAGEEITVKMFADLASEYAFIGKSLRIAMDHGADLARVCVLFRTNQEAEMMVRSLIERGVPFVMSEKLPNLFDHWIYKDLRAYLAMAGGPVTRKDLLRVINRPNRYVSRNDLNAAAAASPPGQVDLFALAGVYSSKDWMAERILTLSEQLTAMKRLSPFAAIPYITEEIGYGDYLARTASERNLDLEELLLTLEKIRESCRGLRSLQSWEERIRAYRERLEQEARERSKARDGVHLATLHGVKGLEFDHVYILNVNEGNIPVRKALLKESLEEERRLFYVGMTRAKKSLTLCLAKNFYKRPVDPSSFLFECGLL